MVPLVGDADPLVSHVAVTALTALRAAGPVMKAVDASTPKLVPGALRVLQGLHETAVVDDLAEKLKTTREPALRAKILGALARLHFREADWSGDWWGTRPDTSGPYFKTAEWEGTQRVQAVLKNALASERPEVVKELAVAMAKNKVDVPELTATLQRLAASDPSFKSVMIDLVAEKRDLNEPQLAMLQAVAGSATEATDVRVKALRVLQKSAARGGGLEAALNAFGAVAGSLGKDKELTAAFNEFTGDAGLSQQIPALTKVSEGAAVGPKKDVATLILLNLSTNKLLAKNNRVQRLTTALDAAWANPKRAAELLGAIGRLHADAYADKVKSLTKDANPQVASAARAAEQQLGKGGKTNSGDTTAVAAGGTIEKLPYEKVVAVAVKEKGDAGVGKELFTKLGCVQCHTVSPEEPPKGPFLGGIAQRYGRAELCESILKPSAKISQGFETQWFKTADDDDYEGFVTRDAGDEIDVRNIVGVTTTIKKSEIKERGKREVSVMPEGLVAKLTPQELAGILAYLETLKGK
jgi:putative heme-binding domain-containing protein